MNNFSNIQRFPYKYPLIVSKSLNKWPPYVNLATYFLCNSHGPSIILKPLHAFNAIFNI